MQANYLMFKKQYKQQHQHQGWTKKIYWEKLNKEWQKISSQPVQIQPKTKPAKPFPFQQFTVEQSDDVFKVGTDGVLLGAWSPSENAQRILEIGSGTGYISLMMAQRNQKGQYDAVEIMDKAFQLSIINFSKNPWGTKMNVYHSPFQDFIVEYKYDLITCAPPYFENSTLSGHKEIDVARHKITFSFFSLLQFSQQKLTVQGVLTTIIPFSQKNDLLDAVQKNNMHIQKEIIIQGTPTSPPKRYMVQIGREQTQIQSQNMIIETNGRHFHSPEFIELTKNYYNYFVPESLKYQNKNN